VLRSGSATCPIQPQTSNGGRGKAKKREVNRFHFQQHRERRTPLQQFPGTGDHEGGEPLKKFRCEKPTCPTIGINKVETMPANGGMAGKAKEKTGTT